MMNEIRNKINVLITSSEMEKLIKAGYDGVTPIVKLFSCNLTWLLTGIEDGIAYGYADLGMDVVEWGGLISLEELPTLKVGRVFYIERDKHFSHKDGTNYLKLDTLVGI